MNRKYMKRMLGFVLSLVLLVSSVIVSPPQVALAENDGKVELHYRATGEGKVNFDVDDFSDVPAGFYKVSVKVDGTKDSQFMIENPSYLGNQYMVIWDFTQGGGTIPDTGFVISEGAVLEPVVANTWETDTTRSSVTMKNTLAINKTASGAWEEITEALDEVELHYRSTGDGAYNFDVDDMSKVPTGYYKVKVTVDGTTESYVAIENPSYLSNQYMVIWDFKTLGATDPTTSFTIAQGAVLEPIDPANSWAADMSRSKLVMKSTLMVSKESGTWAEKKLDEIELHYRTTGDGAYNFNVDDMSKVPTGYYKVKVTVDGTTESYVAIENPSYLSNQYMVIWDFKTLGATDPTTSFTIAKNAELEPINPSNSWAADTTRSRIKIKNALTITKESGAWVEKKQDEIELHYRATGDGVFNFDVDDMSKVPVGYYKLNVEVDGTTDTHFLIENASYLNNTYIAIWDCKWDGGVEPTTSIEIAEGAVLEPVVASTWVKDETRSSVKIKNALTITKESGTWEEKKPAEVELHYRATGDGAFNFDVDDMSKVPVGYYRLNVKVDGTTDTHFLIENASYLENAYITIWDCKWDGGVEPTTSIEIAEGAVLEPVVASTWVADTTRSSIKIKNALTVTKVSGTWTETQTQPEQPTQSENLKLTFESIYGIDKNFQFVWEMSDGATPQTGWYRTEAVIDGTSSKVLLQFADNYFWIYPHCFSETPGSESKYPTATFSIAEGATLIPVIQEQWSEDSSRKSYTLSAKVDMAYTNDEWTDIGNQGGTVVEKDPISLKITYNRMFDKHFAFDGELSGGSKPEDGWYRTEAVIDGKSTKICMEYVDGFFFVYSQCFYEMPSDTNTQYPTKSVYIAKGATLTPIKTGSWAKDVNGQPYTLNTKLDLVLSDGTWMDADYKAKIDNITPIKVNIVFSGISGGAMIFNVVTPNGKSISDLYGDWTTARGDLKKGILDETVKKYTYEKVQANYSITGETFYIDGLMLSKLDGVQIEEGTILYPDNTCKIDIPIQIVNRVRVIRDSQDEWVVDTTYTTYTGKVNDATQTTTGSSDNADNQEFDATENGTTDVSVANTDYAAGNIVFADKTTSGTSYVYKEQNGSAPVVLLTVSGSMCGVIVVLLVVLGLKKRKRQAS